MPNYQYIVPNTFTPFTQDEMLKPYLMYAQAYKEEEQKMEDMTDKAAALKYIAEQNPGTSTAQLYQDMEDRINAVRDSLYAHGLNQKSRRDAHSLRSMYSANSSEITRRYNDYKEWRKRMDALSDKDDSVRFSKDSNSVNLDSFAGGAQPALNSVSGNNIAQRAAQAAAAFTSREYRDSAEGQMMGGQYWKYVQENGFDNNALNALIQNLGDNRFPILNQTIGAIRNSYKDKFNEGDVNYFDSRLREGLNTGATYKKQVTPTGNQSYMSPLQKAQLGMQQEEHNAKMEEINFNLGKATRSVRNNDGTYTHYRINPLKGTLISANYDKNGTFIGNNPEVKLGDASPSVTGKNSKSNTSNNKPQPTTLRDQGYEPVEVNSSITSVPGAKAEDISDSEWEKLLDDKDFRQNVFNIAVLRANNIKYEDWKKLSFAQQKVYLRNIKKVRRGKGWEYVIKKSNSTSSASNGDTGE